MNSNLAPPSFVIRPTAQSVEASSDASFECKSIGTNVTMFWSIEGNRSLIFPGSKLNHFEAKSTPEGLTVLTVSEAKRSDNGLVIICSAINLVGAISVRSKLTVTSQEDRPPPIIIQGPVNQTLPVKSVALLNCKASGMVSSYFNVINLVYKYNKFVIDLKKTVRNTYCGQLNKDLIQFFQLTAATYNIVVS